jgi:molybdopterin-containing oxidoreductase family iron-sulfur binding subunit
VPLRLWRDRDELERNDAFFAALENEFPRQAAPLAPFGAAEGVDRRRFLQLMGASLALGGATACTRQPLEKIVPYVRQPEEIVPGQPLYFATAAPVGGYARGVLVESHMGRPTKIEGNPEHPASLGATDARTQAAVLDLYDPDRSQTLVHLGRIRTWEAFVEALTMELATQQGTGGAGLRILTGPVSSPTLAAQLRAVQTRFPASRWYQWSPTAERGAHLGAMAAFGRPVATRYDLAAAEVVVALDADLLDQGPGAVRCAKDFAKGRRVWERGAAPDGAPAMNRLYVAESTPSPTGTLADHRLALAPRDIAAFALSLAAELGVPGATAPAGWSHPEAARLLPGLAADLQAHRGRSVVAAGLAAAPEVHVLAHAINQHLGNVGTTVVHTEPVLASPSDPLADLQALVADLGAGRVEALFVLGVNPVYDAPADLGFARAMLSPAARLRVHCGLHQDETAQYCHWHVPSTHWLESWGDSRAFDGTATIQQPLVEPLYSAARSAHDLLAVLEERPGTEPRQIVQEQWQARLGGEAAWRRALHDGVVPGTAAPSAGVSVSGGAVAAATQAIGSALAAPAGLVLAFRPDPSVGDGAQANNGWLQELPKPFTKVVWDNPALVSPRTARELGVTAGEHDGLPGRRADLLRIAAGGRELTLPVWVLPGQADGVITLHLGHGRTHSGKVGNGVGFATHTLRTAAGLWNLAGAAASRADGEHRLASTQGHFVMEDRPLVRHATLAEYQARPDFVHAEHPAPPPGLHMYEGEWKYEGYKWGMAINLSACTGCNACVVACQSENNIAVVGKEQVYRGREMHWLRIDQYFAGDYDQPAAVYNQPVPCMHCENAPCEVVCPVAATAHSSEGLNDMVYNRCVGTRYCANNCPYKVRRFNFYKFADWQTESIKLQRNPDVTVRARGVMEKCSYCVQRINAGRIAAETDQPARRIRDGEVVPACAQACPTEAIVFGDLNDPAARVTRWRAQSLNYGLLEDLNTRPRTTYMGRLSNPQTDLEPEA